MDFGILGVIDIILILLAVLVCLLGYKKGFLKKAIGLVSFIVAVIVAFAFCSQLAGLFQKNEIIYPSIYQSVYQNITATEAFRNPDATVVDLLTAIKIPKFIAQMLANAIDSTKMASEMAADIAHYMAKSALNVICFFILFFGVFVVALLLKIISGILRKSKLIRVVDGLFGIVLYGCLFILVVEIIFTILHYCIGNEWFHAAEKFLEVDMQLNSNRFRISKYIYEHNTVYEIIHILF